MVIVEVVVVAVAGELWAKQAAERPQVSAMVVRIRVFIATKLEELSTEGTGLN